MAMALLCEWNLWGCSRASWVTRCAVRDPGQPAWVGAVLTFGSVAIQAEGVTSS